MGGALGAQTKTPPDPLGDCGEPKGLSACGRPQPHQTANPRIVAADPAKNQIRPSGGHTSQNRTADARLSKSSGRGNGALSQSQNFLIKLIRGYQKGISPWLGGNCRFAPSCSEAARQAVEAYGPAKGIWYSLKRIFRCHPFHPGGYEPVLLPEKQNG